MLAFIHAQRQLAADVTAKVDNAAMAIFLLEYLDNAGKVVSLGNETPANTSFTWRIDPAIFSGAPYQTRVFRLYWRPATQNINDVNLWLQVDQSAKQLSALHPFDPANTTPPYRAGASANGIQSICDFAVVVD